MTDIFNRIINIIGFGLTTGSQKRKSEELLEHSQLTKYRKVSSDFPKLINKPFEDDFNFLRAKQPQQKKLGSNSRNMSNRKSFGEKPYNFNILRTNQRNYGDLEYSDAEDEENIINSADLLYTRSPLASSSLRKCYNSKRTVPQSTENIFATKRNPCIINVPIKILDTPLSNACTGMNSTKLNTLTGYIEQPISRNSSEFQSNQIPYLAPIRKVASAANEKYNCFGNSSESFGSKKSFLSLFNKKRAKNLTHASYLVGQPQKVVSQIYNEKEKESYEHLLKQLAPNLYSSANGSFSPFSSSKIVPRKAVGSTVQPQSTGLGIIVDNIDLTKSKGVSNQSKITNGSTINLDVDEEDVIELDDEVQIVNAVKKLNCYKNQDEKSEKEPKKKQGLPYVVPVNSLKEKIELAPIYKPEWLKSFYEKIHQRKNEKLQKCREAEAEVCEATKRTYENERLLGEKMKNFHIGNEIIILDEEEEAEEEIEFPDLIEFDEVLKNAIYGGSPDQVLITKFNMSICRRDIKTLCGDNWLNDEVINFYMNLLIERGDAKNMNGYPKVYAMNTFFIPKLMSSGHSGVRRWTRKIDIFAHDIIPVPVHVSGVHWCMAIINLKEKTIKYYDSMRTPNLRVLDALEQYLIDESMDKKKQHFDTSHFLKESVSDCPRQMNGSDCGVFSCMFAEYTTRGKPITFSQQHMPYFRNKMILEIIQGKLML